MLTVGVINVMSIYNAADFKSFQRDRSNMSVIRSTNYGTHDDLEAP